MTIARLNVMKGHVHALRAMKRARARGIELTYTIAGEGPERESIEAEIRRLELAPFVRLAGSLGEDDVLALLRKADAFVLPSYGEGEAAPVSVMEAMSCALPVICSIIGGTPDMIDHDRSGLLVEQRDESALEEAFVRLAEDLALRARLANEARERAREAFDYRANAARLGRAIAQHGDRPHGGAGSGA